MARAAVRQHYDPNWGKPCEDQGAFDFTVEIKWTRTEYETTTYQIRADSEEEAKEKAREIWTNEDSYGDDARIENCDIVKMTDSESLQ